MKPNLLVNIIAFFFILLFLYTGIAKFMEIKQFKEQMIASPLLGSIAGFVAWALPIGEILLSILLFVPVWRLKGLYISAGLMTLFTGYVIGILLIDSHLSCSCGGIVEELTPKQHLVFNTACIILAVVAILVARRQQFTRTFRWLTTSGTLCLFLLMGWTLFTAFTTPATVKTGLEGRLLPSFNLLLPDSSTYLNTTDIPAGKPLIFVGFSPVCVHCQTETRAIIKNIDRFKDARIYFVTTYPFTDMKVYYQYFKLAAYPNITMGADTKDYFFPYFKAHSIPYFAIYDSKKRLKQAIVGEYDINALAKITLE